MPLRLADIAQPSAFARNERKASFCDLFVANGHHVRIFVERTNDASFTDSPRDREHFGTWPARHDEHMLTGSEREFTYEIEVIRNESRYPLFKITFRGAVPRSSHRF